MPSPSPQGRTRSPGLAALAAALVGCALAGEAIFRGGLSRYVLFGIGVGAALLLPLAAILLFGASGRRMLRKLLFAAVPCALLLALLELAFRVLDLRDPTTGTVVASDAYGLALLPQPGLADAHGFRNATIPTSAQVLCIGDSFTWGFGVAARDSYPQALAKRSGRSVYNASLGGYGPIQYRELARNHLRLRPEHVILGVYLGNDVLNAVAFAALPCAADLRREGFPYPPLPPLPGAGAHDAPAPNLAVGLAEQVAKTSRLLSYGGGLLRERLRYAVPGWDAEPGTPGLREGPIATLFAPHLVVPTDLDSAAAQEGLRLSERCIADVARMCREAGAKPWLLVFPTKEAVYCRFLEQAGQSRPELQEAASSGARLVDAFARIGAENGCAVLDLSPHLLAALERGEPMWPAGSDPHLAAGGYGLAAEVVAAALATDAAESSGR